MINIQYSPIVIQEKRQKVREQVLRESTNLCTGVIDRISDTDLRLLYQCYDRIFLDGWLNKHLNQPLRLTLSTRLSKAAGKTMVRFKQGSREILDIEIRIGTSFLFNHHQLERDKYVAGLPAQDGVEALMLVMEHELCHVLEYCLYGESSCSRERFKILAANLFGHTSNSHQLPTDTEIAMATYGYEPGETVVFSYDNHLLQGVITQIRKRAAVMVQDPGGQYIDKKGLRYTKYYVPLSHLERKQ